MRAIKFRVFIHPHCGGGIPQECYNTMDYSDNYGGDLEEFFGLYKPHFFEIMQFTGLTDKNGKEIYEGDILRTPHFLDDNGEQLYLYHRVVWCDRLTGWQAVNMNETTDPPYLKTGSPQLWVYAKDEFEVIGNIHKDKSFFK